MTGNDGHGRRDDPLDGAPSVELLADLHAGVLDEAQAAELRERVAADPQARAVLEALDATVTELAALPAQPIPTSVAERIDSALAAEAARPTGAPVPPAGVPGFADVAGFAGSRSRRRRSAAWVSAAVLTTAAAVVGVVVLLGGPRHTAGIPRAGDAPGVATGVGPTAPQALTSDELGGMLSQALAQRRLGPLSEPGRLQGCLAANGVTDRADPLGAMPVTVDGRRGVLLVLPTGRIAQFRLLVVGEDCAPGHPAPLADQLIGPR